MPENQTPQPDDPELPLIAHLAELRGRLLRTLAAVCGVFLVLSFFAGDIHTLVAAPLLAQIPGDNMIATEVASPFLVPFKLTLFVAILITAPYLLYHAWAFVAPGLYRDERRFILPLLTTSVILFYLGNAFAYFVVFPVVFEFFNSFAPAGVTVMTDITHHLNFVLKMSLAFGLAFEVPIAAIILIRTGITTAADLRGKRPYIIVGAFAVGMLLTPPDIISQLMLALPVWLLFESGLYLSRFFAPAEADGDEGED
ncbi:MAG: twin-arginine translocase subunit TatC [Gammaproteobacteria bacterium]